MRKISTLAAISTSLLIAACNTETETRPDLPMEFAVDSYESVSVDGQVKVVFHHQEVSDNELVLLKASTASLRTSSSKNTGGFLVKIKADPVQRRYLQVRSEGGKLIITAESNIVLSDSVTVDLYTGELYEIRLESDQEAEFHGGFDQESLSVVTEARSKLGLYDFRVDHLSCKTEGESEITLSTFSENMDENQSFDEWRGVLLDDQTLIVDNSVYVQGDSVKLEGEVWAVYGEEVTSYFEMQSCDFKTEGQTYIDAIGASSRNVNIKLEGQSEARVWAAESLTGKGEGNATLYYRNVSGVDISGFITEGSAQIVAVE